MCYQNRTNTLASDTVAEEEVTLAVVGPAERQYLALAASRQQEEPDDGDLLRTPICVGRQSRGQAAYLLVGQEARSSLAAVASDSQAGVGALGPKTHGFRLPQDDGEHRHGPVGGDRGRAQRCEPVPNIPPVDVGDLPSLEAGQDLVLQVAPVDIERSRLPEPPVSFEHGLGDGLEEGLGGIAGRVLSTSDGGESSHGTRPRFVHAHSGCVAEDLPDSVSSMLGMDEEAFAAGGQDPDTEASEFAVANVVGDLAGSKRPDTGVGEGGSGHACSPGCGCSRGSGSCAIRSAATMIRRKNDHLSDS